MASRTRRALQDFDNQHDFERLAADVLNSLGYVDVEPMAVVGGRDRGVDIRFREGETAGRAFVTLEKAIVDKFKSDLAKQEDGQGLIALFCNVDVSPTRKVDFTKQSLAKGYRLDIFDLERIRSLLDTGFKDIRRRYLGIDDEVAAKLRADVKRLLRYPDAAHGVPEPPTMVESFLADQVPRKLFEMLLAHDERDIAEVPLIGQSLDRHLHDYYAFRQGVQTLEGKLLARIGRLVSVQFSQAWRIYLRYVLLRFGGASKEEIVAWGNFLNYEITWDNAEDVYQQLLKDPDLAREVANLFASHQELAGRLTRLRDDL